jgi:hypothetical protein
MAVDFSKILQKQSAEIEKPVPLPIGTYLCNNPALPSFVGIGKNETPCATFNLVVLQPSDDVDAADLAAIPNWKGKGIRHRMFLTEDSLFRTKEELVNAFALEEGDKSLGQLFNESVGKQVWVTIKHRPSDDGTTIYTEVEKLAAA